MNAMNAVRRATAPAPVLGLVLGLVGPALAGLGCAATPRPTASAPRPAAAPASAPAPSPRPRLVLAVVIDQLGSDALERLAPLLEQGAYAHARARGRVIERVVYGFAATLTAPGHAAIFSGAPPSVSGVVANSVIDWVTGERRAVIDDREHEVLGVPTECAAPSVMRVLTVADVLEAHTGGAARTVALSIKDRSAVLPAGKRPDLVLFHDPTVGFTTSSCYMSALPEWVTAFARAHPVDPTAVRWEVPDAARLQALLGPDDGPGEGDMKGLGTRFPHRLAGNPRATELWDYTPDATEHLFELAFEAARQLALGEDDVPDLLVVSVSGTDYTGHVFGPDSWEYADHLRRADRALLRLYERLAERTELAVLVTSDHGVARVPERVHATVPTATRIDGRALAAAIEVELDALAGTGDWVLGYVEPYVYLSQWARERDDAAMLRARALTVAARQPGVYAAFDGTDPAAVAHPDPELVRKVRASLYPERSGDLLIVPAFGAIPDSTYTPGAGTTHGSPWPYDAEVPVLLWGAGVAPGHDVQPLSQARVASTLAALLGIPPPPTATEPPLPGVAPR